MGPHVEVSGNFQGGRQSLPSIALGPLSSGASPPRPYLYCAIGKSTITKVFFDDKSRHLHPGKLAEKPTQWLRELAEVLEEIHLASENFDREALAAPAQEYLRVINILER
jgi:hypothetical protein